MTYSWHVFDWMAYKLRAGYEARQHHQLERNAMTQHQTESRLEELIEKIDGLDAKRTKGPWFVWLGATYPSSDFRKNRAVVTFGGQTGKGSAEMMVAKTDYFYPEYADANAAFIVAIENAWPTLRAELSRLREALADQEEQLAFRQPSAVERDMQEVMRINNELLARAEAAEAKLSTIREWQPIETAPKDGTGILVYIERGTLIAYWVETDWIASGLIAHPTHWMPLPDPPAANPLS